MKINLGLVMLALGVVLVFLYLNRKENFQLDRIPWEKICKKEYCDLPNYYNKIYPNKKGYRHNTVYSVNGKCCVLSKEMMDCLIHRGSTSKCKDLF